MQYKKGERVIHKKREEWGVGELLGDISDNKIQVFFTEVGEKTLSLKYAQLNKIEGKEAKNPVLDNLKVSKTNDRFQYRSLAQSKDGFLQLFSDGFYDETYLKKERDYKVKAHNLAKELINAEDLKTLLKESNHDEICERALKIIHSTKLILPKEKKSIKEGLSATSERKSFAESFYQLLYGKGDLEERFTDFSRVLEKIGASKWTIISFLLFIVFPEKYMLVNPTITKKAAEISAFEINYRPEVKWLTYESVLKYSEYCKSELADLKPRDMIDVQTFIWSVASTANSKK